MILISTTRWFISNEQSRLLRSSPPVTPTAVYWQPDLFCRSGFITRDKPWHNKRGVLTETLAVRKMNCFNLIMWCGDYINKNTSESEGYDDLGSGDDKWQTKGELLCTSAPPVHLRCFFNHLSSLLLCLPYPPQPFFLFEWLYLYSPPFPFLYHNTKVFNSQTQISQIVGKIHVGRHILNKSGALFLITKDLRRTWEMSEGMHCLELLKMMLKTLESNVAYLSELMCCRKVLCLEIVQHENKT